MCSPAIKCTWQTVPGLRYGSAVQVSVSCVDRGGFKINFSLSIICMRVVNQYEVFELTRDINPVIKQGMKGVILEVWEPGVYEVEFVKEDGCNYGYNGNYTFTIRQEDIKF